MHVELMLTIILVVLAFTHVRQEPMRRGYVYILSARMGHRHDKTLDDEMLQLDT